MSKRACLTAVVVTLVGFGCAGNPAPDPGNDGEPEPSADGGKSGTPSGKGGRSGSGGATGSGGSSADGGSPGAGGAVEPGAGGQSGGQSGGDGGTMGGDDAAAGSGGGDTPDAGGGSGEGGAGELPPPATGQGPTARGKIAFSNDFEQDMHGMMRSPGGLPPERIQIVDDPAKQRGKVVRIQWIAGDNYRTSGGTEPRSWFSSASGYTAKPGTRVSVAWGFMWENVSMGAHFAQIIRDGGPLWMMDVDYNGNVRGDVHRGSGSTGVFAKLEANKWYDFEVVTDYKGGGKIEFYFNGKLVGTGTGDGGANGRFDCGIYWEHGAKATRTVYVSNVSIGEL